MERFETVYLCDCLLVLHKNKQRIVISRGVISKISPPKIGVFDYHFAERETTRSARF